MRMLAAIAIVSFAAASAFGQAVDLQALKRAQRLNDQNNAQQASSAPAPAAPAHPAPLARPDPVLIATLQNVTNLQADFSTLQNDPAKKQPLMNDLHAAALGGHPSNNSTTRLTDDLAAALAGKHFSLEQQKRLAQYVHATFNCQHLSRTQELTIFDDVKGILQNGGVSSDQAAKVVIDLKACAAEIQ